MENNYTTKMNDGIISTSMATMILKEPRVIAIVKLLGCPVFVITDDMQFEKPTEEQRENLKKTFGIEVELVDEEGI